MTEHEDVSNRVFSRGFILSQESASDLSQKLHGKPYNENLASWDKTYFGPCTLWVDPRLNYARTRDRQIGVGVLGLCINPFDGLSNNQDISEELYRNLSQGREKFFEYVDQLSGSFVIIYRENAHVFVLQDAAATKPVYYHISEAGLVTVSSHASLVRHINGLEPDPRLQQVYESEAYRKDPSRYLPGMVTAFSGLYPLTANHELDISHGKSRRFFPREPLEQRPFGSELVDEISALMQEQAKIIGRMGRPLLLAATGGRDSRVSAVTFSGQPDLQYYSFHMPSTGHLSEDTEIAAELAKIEQVPINIYELENYKSPEFTRALREHSPRGIWPAAALCYIREFPADAIHIRSTVSEIGRVFYSKRTSEVVTPEVLANIYTRTDFSSEPMVVETMRDFIDITDFDTSVFFNYSLYDMFYWEHRNSKWQNILCAEAEMATDVFIPFNNRNLLKLFMSVPYESRLRADIHQAIFRKLNPRAAEVRIA